MALSSAIPVTIVAGYLGAGKTTLVNHLLRNADGLRLAVLVNDFGELPIDADLIIGQEGDVISIAGGCICCSFGSDLVGTLQEIARMEPRPDHLLLETSGVALPAPVAATLSLIGGLALEAIVVLADAETIERHGRDRYLGDTIAAQLIAADLVVLNKCDLVPEQRLGDVEKWITRVSPRARIVKTTKATLPRVLLLGLDQANRTEVMEGAGTLDLGPAPVSYETRVIELSGSIDPHALAEALAKPELGLLRAKGLVTDPAGGRWSVQVVGQRFEVAPALSGGARMDQLVCIGLRGRLEHERLDRLCASAR